MDKKRYTKCLECGGKMEAGSNACPFCNTVFTDDDVQVMLDVYRKHKKNGFKVFLCFAVLVIFLTAIYYGADYAGKRAKETIYAKEMDFCVSANSLIRSIDGVKDCSVEPDAVSIILNKAAWKDVPQEERLLNTQSLWYELMKMQRDKGVKSERLLELMVLDSKGNILVYIDEDGRAVNP